jgi:transcriptional regulator with XRE-family HTH domain
LQGLIVGFMLGDELRKAREAAGLSQEDLAYKAKVDRTYVSMLERGKNSPTVEVLFRICRALRVSPSEVIARVEKASKVSATRR